nr:transcriptional regulator EFH1 isoform X2 [Ipomoea batatas]
MKWTDNMVRLLIMVVYYIGDEVGSEDVLQKKGKWKSVSRAMMERGLYVSPQQCEDKFNDLNKRYKRVNDIIGKGTACKVVENQTLLETLDLSPKMKEEAKREET